MAVAGGERPGYRLEGLLGWHLEDAEAQLRDLGATAQRYGWDAVVDVLMGASCPATGGAKQPTVKDAAAWAGSAKARWCGNRRTASWYHTGSGPGRAQLLTAPARSPLGAPYS